MVSKVRESLHTILTIVQDEFEFSGQYSDSIELEQTYPNTFWCQKWDTMENCPFVFRIDNFNGMLQIEQSLGFEYNVVIGNVYDGRVRETAHPCSAAHTVYNISLIQDL